MNKQQFVAEVLNIIHDDSQMISDTLEIFWQKSFGSGLTSRQRQQFKEFSEYVVAPDVPNATGEISESLKIIFADYKDLREKICSGDRSIVLLYAAQMCFILIVCGAIDYAKN